MVWCGLMVFQNFLLLELSLIFQFPKDFLQQINFSGNLERDNNDDKTQMFIILEEVKEIIFDFSQWTLKVL